jgi:peptidoglycan/xylan/chitin deacetylase (PgdA/CDA1 family)
MRQAVAIIMYHYVRDRSSARYASIPALDTAAFRGQLRYLQRNHTIIGAEELVGAVTAGTSLPTNAALLTFDDGYSDHFTTVFPILEEEGLRACFFPPSESILERRLLDVNKIHHILDTADDINAVVRQMEKRLQEHRSRHSLPETEILRSEHAHDGRYDSAPVVYVKRLLQHALPRSVRRAIVDELFQTFVDVAEATLANELYMSLDQIRMLVRHGMYVGHHSHTHPWMDRLSDEEQRSEVRTALEFLEEIGMPREDWMMCYPYGRHDARLRALVRAEGAAVGLTIRPRVARIGMEDPLALPRLDTNDVPTSERAPVSEWPSERNSRVSTTE